MIKGMIASIVCVGTELTIGQIVNRNSAWIAQKLKALGVPSSLHIVIPDERGLILEALEFAGARGDLIFVTGGLGPTSDDFTRDLIAEWVKQPLEFDQGSWDHVNKRLGERQIAVREAQRQQCYFPKGSVVLQNSEGTANGFRLRLGEKDVFVLPGPPREIEALWQHVDPYLQQKTRDIDKRLIFVWDTMGLGESDVSHMTETCLQGVEVEKGYRVHLPYVEVKLSFFESQKPQLMPWVEKLDEVLRPITVTRNEEDVAQLLGEKLKSVRQLQVSDAVSGGVLLGRLSSSWKYWLGEKTWSFSNDLSAPASPEALHLVLRPLGTTEAIAEFHHRGAVFRDELKAPIMMAKMKERRALYYTERALIFWLQQAVY